MKITSTNAYPINVSNANATENVETRKTEAQQSIYTPNDWNSYNKYPLKKPI